MDCEPLCFSRDANIFKADLRSRWTIEILWAITTSRVASTWPTRDVAANAADVRWLETHNYQFPEQSPNLWSFTENPIHDIWLEGRNNIHTSFGGAAQFFIDDYERQLQGKKPEWDVLIALAHPDATQAWESRDPEKLTKIIEDVRKKRQPPDHQKPTSDAFVFISYHNEDQHYCDEVSSLLASENIATWTMKDIPPGANWDAEIDKALNEAAAVVTLWTPKSVDSDPVKEEAHKGGKSKKFFGVKREECDLPYGFAMSQYADLIGWDGKTKNRETDKLLEEIKIKLGTTLQSRKDLVERLAKSSPVYFKLENGSINVGDSPKGHAPEINNPQERSDLAKTLSRAVMTLIELAEGKTNEFAPDDAIWFKSYKNELDIQQDENNWSATILETEFQPVLEILNDAISDQRLRVGLNASVNRIIHNHNELIKTIKPVNPPPEASDNIQDQPLIETDTEIDHQTRTLSFEANETLRDERPENVLSPKTKRLFADIFNRLSQNDPNGPQPSGRFIKMAASILASTSLFLTQVVIANNQWTITFAAKINALLDKLLMVLF